jgi:adenylate kinase family enzyme
MRKVLVIGSPGSGKSTFAARLAPALGLPVIHLDRIYHDGYSNDRLAWRKHVRNELITRERWVMDGHHPATLAVRIEAADTVIYLDYPTRICLARAIRRRLAPPVARPDMPPGWRERLSISLLRSILLFRTTEAHRVRELLARPAPGRRVITLSSPAEAEAFLAVH